MKPRRRATVAIALLVVLVVLQLVIVGVSLGGARDQNLTLARLDAVRAFYAAEAGVNMSVRELMINLDEDGDGAIGSISNDAVASNDPNIAGLARVFVSKTVAGGTTTLTSQARSGAALNSIQAVIK